MFKDICFTILGKLQNMSKDSDKETLLLKYVENRLDESYNSYVSDLNNSLSFLKRRDELRMMRKLNKLK